MLAEPCPRGHELQGSVPGAPAPGAALTAAKAAGLPASPLCVAIGKVRHHLPHLPRKKKGLNASLARRREDSMNEVRSFFLCPRQRTQRGCRFSWWVLGNSGGKTYFQASARSLAAQMPTNLPASPGKRAQRARPPAPRVGLGAWERRPEEEPRAGSLGASGAAGGRLHFPWASRPPGFGARAPHRPHRGSAPRTPAQVSARGGAGGSGSGGAPRKGRAGERAGRAGGWAGRTLAGSGPLRSAPLAARSPVPGPQFPVPDLPPPCGTSGWFTAVPSAPLHLAARSTHNAETGEKAPGESCHLLCRQEVRAGSPP